MTHPHLMNCDHSEEGWCLECVKKLHAEKEFAESRDGQRHSHSRDELRYVADILSALNNVPHDNNNGVGIQGQLRLYWYDRELGLIDQLDDDDLRSWHYFPAPKLEEGGK